MSKMVHVVGSLGLDKKKVVMALCGKKVDARNVVPDGRLDHESICKACEDVCERIWESLPFSFKVDYIQDEE